MAFTGTITGVSSTIAALDQLDDRIYAALGQGVARGVQGGVSIVRGKASGRPGPRVITGAFRRSIQSDSEVSGSTAFGAIGTNAPQGARLEFGFTGEDAIGRYYDQPPFPYLQPAGPEVAELVATEIVSALGRELG